MSNFKLTVSYDGTDFSGWQTQPAHRTVQETLETAIGTLTHETIRVNASGRTDSGVHAVGQVVNFHSETRIPATSMVRAINAHLSGDVVVTACEQVHDTFDANRDAIRKLYRYVICDGATLNPFMRRYAYHCRHSLDAMSMRRAALPLIGEHDFHSFETDWPNRATSVRTILHLSVNRVGEYIWIDIEADGFLYNMVRAIAGTLINVGRGFWPESQVEAILRAEDRRQAGPTAPTEGLFLMRVTYE